MKRKDETLYKDYFSMPVNIEHSLMDITVRTKSSGNPSLILDGFDTYKMLHETFALTRIIYYVLTGKTNTDNISDSKLHAFVQKGLNPDKSKRFQNVNEVVQEFRNL